MAERSDLLPFGVVGRPHGVHGELTLRPFNEGGRALDAVRPPLSVELIRGESRDSWDIVALRRAPDGYLVRFAGVETREQAAALTSAEVLLPRAALAPLAEGEFYVEDLRGCEVFAPDGKRLGRVEATFWNGGQDVLSVRSDEGEELLFPAVPAFVVAFDAAARRVTIDPHE